MVVRDNHTKYEPDTQRWWPGWGRPKCRTSISKSVIWAKISLFLPEAALEPTQSSQMKGDSGYSTHATTLPCAKGPFRALYLHNMSANCPQQTPKKPQNLCKLAADSPKPKTDHILGYVAQNPISSAPSPPATTHFWWFSTLRIAVTDA